MARLKALAHDLIPDCILGKYESETLEKKRLEFVKSRLEKTNSQEFFKHMVGRLIILNKKPGQPPTTGSVRPITAISPIRKALEYNALSELQQVMLERIHCGQTGFIKDMGCQVNLLRIGEQLLKNKKSPYKESGIIFFDFKSAFDLVDHDILMEKVRKLELS